MKFAASALTLTLTACSMPIGAEQPEIDPADFALLPCGLADDAPPCALAVIGGKRLLFGAPAGVGTGFSKGELGQLDGVLLFSLRARDTEGLDEVRNASWQAGRDRPLSVAGPQGTGQVISGLNLAFETADALRIVDEGVPKGGFDAALLVEMQRTLADTNIVFDTGDVVITAEARADQSMKYMIRYLDSELTVLEPCRNDDCSFAVDQTWPLTAPHFIVKTES